MSSMRRVVCVAAYVPATRSHGKPAAALDEDAFTLAATAAERAWRGRREEPGPILVHLLGEFPPVAEWGFSAVLGRNAEVVRHPGDAGELGPTLRSLEGGEGGAALVIAASIPERGVGRPPARAAPTGAAAVAFLLEPSEAPGPFPLGKPGAHRSAVGAALRLGEPGKEGIPRATFVGDWEPPPEAGPSVNVPARDEPTDAGLSAVSEGAYVPRARYLENLPSRWRFLAEACGACHGTTFPARRICRRCGRQDSLTPVELPYDGGRVVAVTTVGSGGQPTEFDAQVAKTGPYDVALVELARSMRVTLQVTDIAPGTVRVGDRVNTMLRRLYPMEGEWRYGRKAVPVASPAPAGKRPSAR